MLNTKIKNFNTIVYFNKKFFNINEQNLKNKWTVFFCFPFCFSFICPTELKELSNNIEIFKKKNIQVFGFSTDSHFSHKNWIEKELKFINFPFISDFNKNISKNINILNKKDGNCLRSTFIIDPNLIIKSIDILDITISRSIKCLINRCEMLIFTNLNNNKVCPNNWIIDKKSINII
ncbi:MAG: redoxin domain-containing protein [Candidatus Carsonella ruddii]